MRGKTLGYDRVEGLGLCESVRVGEREDILLYVVRCRTFDRKERHIVR